MSRAGILCFSTLIVAGIVAAAERASIRWRVMVAVRGGSVITDASFGDYRIHIERNVNWIGSLTAKIRVLYGSRQIFAEEKGAIPQVHFWKDNELVAPDDRCCEGNYAMPLTIFNPAIEIARDITGDGVPGLLLTEEPAAGGNAVMRLWTVLSLAPLDRVTAELSGDAIGGNWHYLPGQRLPVFDTMDAWPFWDGLKDHCFCHWCIGTRVTLRYRDGAYRIAEDVMRKAKFSEGDLAAMAAEMRPGFHDNCPSDALFNRMLELIFSGNAASAFRCLT